MYTIRRPLLCTFLTLCTLAIATVSNGAEPVKLWHENHITPEQPFPARVVGVIPSWIGYALLLEEITDKEPRYCIARLRAIDDLNYTIVPDKKAFHDVHDFHKATYLHPGVAVNDFSWSMGAYTIGRRFGDRDFVTEQYPRWTKRAANRKGPVPKEDQAGDTSAVYGEALSTLAIILPRDHPSHHPLDEEIAGRWFDLFIDSLDPRRVYFTADDIRRFAEHRRDLDDDARRGDLSFALSVRDTYGLRLSQATKMGMELLDERHDFTVDEQFQLQPDTFPENAAALRERWRKRVKYEILVERSTGLSIDRAIAKLRARYRRVQRDNQVDEEELYEVYLDAFARSFGPHNRYLGERTLSKYRS